MKILSALKGIGGEYELNRIVGAIGAFAYVVGANGFVAWDVVAKGREFDLTAYCLAFPGGLAAVVGAIAGSVAIKDRNVATAKAVEAQTARNDHAAAAGGVAA